MIAVIAFGRISSVMRDVSTPITGLLTSGVNNTAANSASVKTHVGRSRPRSHSGSDTPRMAAAASPQGLGPGDEHDGDDRPDKRSGTERAVEEARDPWAAEVEVGMCGQRGGQCRAEETKHHDHEDESAHERVPRDEAQALQ